ncbi:MAG: septation protein A [Pseudomonadota bacterium]
MADAQSGEAETADGEADAKPVGTKDQPAGFLKFALEVGPLAVFFLVNSQAERFGLSTLGPLRSVAPDQVAIMAATAAFMVAIVISLTVSLAVYRKVPVMPLVSGVIVLVFGGLTLYLQDELFIKLKPTIVNLLFSGILLGGLFIFKKPLLGIVFDSVIQLDEAGWRKLTLRWGLFFLFLAVLNEVIWRNFSTDFWVAFKVFGAFPITMAFFISQVPLMMRHAQEDGASKSP